MTPQRSSDPLAGGPRDRGGRLGRRDWLEAAIEMGADVGFDHLAVEPLARRVGASKGSFYWHFAGLSDLVDTVVAAWEQQATFEVIADVADAPPSDRIRLLVERVIGGVADEPAEWAMLAAVAHPQIGPAVARVHAARMAFLRQLVEDAGVPPHQAATRARIGYGAYLGHLHLVHAQGVDALDADGRRRISDEVVRLLEAQPSPG